jgi:hypothetical protein
MIGSYCMTQIEVLYHMFSKFLAMFSQSYWAFYGSEQISQVPLIELPFSSQRW